MPPHERVGSWVWHVPTEGSNKHVAVHIYENNTHTHTHSIPHKGHYASLQRLHPMTNSQKASPPHTRGIVMSAREKEMSSPCNLPHATLFSLQRLNHASLFFPLHFYYSISLLLLKLFLPSFLSCILFPLQFSFHHLHLSLVFRITPPSSSIWLLKCKENSFSSHLVSSHILSCYISLSLDEFTNWFC